MLRALEQGSVWIKELEMISTICRANSVEDAVRRGQRQVEKVKLKMSMQMDDKAFQSALLDTQVLRTVNAPL